MKKIILFSIFTVSTLIAKAQKVEINVDSLNIIKVPYKVTLEPIYKTQDSVQIYYEILDKDNVIIERANKFIPIESGKYFFDKVPNTIEILKFINKYNFKERK